MCIQVAAVFATYPCEDSSVVCAVHSKEAIYLVNISNHYEPVRRK